jgi:glycosyltransferase involved in cell wall biosynthesis
MKKATTGKLSSLSLFFPAYNEEANITSAVIRALRVLPTVAEEFEVIIINDGSTDHTRAIANELARKYRQVRVIHQRNKGYGGAVKRGFKEVRYDWVFFTDSDLQFDLDELSKLVDHANDSQVILGYRQNRAEGLRRSLLASALKVWNWLLLGFPQNIKDIDCAFKLIRKEVVRTIEPLFSNGAMVSTELLLKIHAAGFTYTQVGVSHYPRLYGSSTGSNLRVILKAVVDTFILRRQIAEGRLNRLSLTRSS